MSLTRRLRDGLTDQTFGLAWRAGRGIPERPVLAIAQHAADRAVRRNGRGVVQLRANLRRVLARDGRPPSAAELDAAVRQAMRSYARYWVETFRLPRMVAADVVAASEVTGFERIDRAAAAGRGVVLALPHSGNWETAGILLLSHGYPFTTVAERLRPESLYRRFVAYREALGMRVIPLSGGDPVVPALTEVLGDGGVVCLLGDRSLGSGGVEVSLFGEPAMLPAGPAMLAARTGATLLSVGCWYTPSGWGVTVTGPVAAEGRGLAQRTRATTQALADTFEQHIRAHPTDWHMLQPVWSADRPG